MPCHALVGPLLRLNFTLPITGGSGRYQGAGGQVVSRDMSTPTQPQVELTFQLED